MHLIYTLALVINIITDRIKIKAKVKLISIMLFKLLSIYKGNLSLGMSMECIIVRIKIRKYWLTTLVFSCRISKAIMQGTVLNG